MNRAVCGSVKFYLYLFPRAPKVKLPKFFCSGPPVPQALDFGRSVSILGAQCSCSGVILTSGGSLIITDCIIRNFTTRGITLQPQGTTAFDIADMTVSRTGAAIEVQPRQAGKAFGTFTHVSMNDSGTGIVIAGPVTALAIASTAINNSHGFDVAPGAVLRLAHSTSSGNALGIFVVNGGTIESAGDNFINGNTQDFDGTLTKFDTQ